MKKHVLFAVIVILGAGFFYKRLTQSMNEPHRLPSYEDVMNEDMNMSYSDLDMTYSFSGSDMDMTYSYSLRLGDMRMSYSTMRDMRRTHSLKQRGAYSDMDMTYSYSLRSDDMSMSYSTMRDMRRTNSLRHRRA